MKLVDQLVDLIRATSSALPADVLKALRSAVRRETKGSPAAAVLRTILDNCKLAKNTGLPLCQDTGTLTFFVDERLLKKVTPAVLKRAVAEATERGYLRKNCIDSVSGKSYDDNCALGAPVVHYVRQGFGDGGVAETMPRPDPAVTLLLKGGGSENMSRQYSLPDASLGAGRDLEGVRKCVLDAVQKIQGYGCAPGILGVCIGGDRATGYEVAKEQLLRPLDEEAKVSGEGERRNASSFGDAVGRAARLARPLDEKIAELEKELLREANGLGIGPMGLGGKTTLLGVKVAARPRVPASFFVTIAYMCWACRRRTLAVGPSSGTRPVSYGA